MFLIRGINGDKSFCECCGRQGLERVVWIENTETGEVKHFGTSCAGQPRKGFGVDAELKAAIREHSAKLRHVWSAAAIDYRKGNGAYENGRDKDGSPVRSVVDAAYWEVCVARQRRHRGI